MNKVLNKKYKILDKIGLGKFGVVYKGIHLKTIEFVAIKTESKTASIKLLKNETTILKYLYDNSCRSIPIIYWYGIDNEFTYLVMSFYEISLHDYSINNNLSIEKIEILCPIKNFNGLELFTNLKEIVCNSNYLTSLNRSLLILTS
jgi:serine/threonine protein kinase